MKTPLVVIIAILSICIVIPAQTQAQDGASSSSLDLKEFSLTLKTGLMHSRADIRTTDFWGISVGDQSEHQLGVGLGATYMINSGVGIMLEGKIGKLIGIADLGRAGQPKEDNLNKIVNAFGTEDVFYETSIMQGSINAYVNISNLVTSGNVFKKMARNEQNDRKFSLYGYGGIGWLRFDSEIKTVKDDKIVPNAKYLKGYTNETTELVLPYGFGAKYNLCPMFDIGIDFNNQFIFSDKLDAWVQGNSNDSYNFTSVALTYKFGTKDKDAAHMEWVSPIEMYARYAGENNKNDLTDSDNDGVIDQLDKEPNSVKGAIVDSKGVTRDSDGDGCPDHLDPEPYSIASLPIKDCKNYPSFADTDGDGIIDSMDKCPEEKGSIEFFGCAKDISTPVEVVVEKKDLENLKIAGRKIRFETGSARLSKASYPVLDEVYEILVKYPQYKVRVDGHTDSDGSESANQLLSQNRAAFAMKYLVDKGLESGRMSAAGFGEISPIAPNTTAAGKAQNRRIEFSFYR